jgi:hypothetical protein
MFIVNKWPFDLLSPFMGDRKHFTPMERGYFQRRRCYKHYAATRLGLATLLELFNSGGRIRALFDGV